VGSAARRLGAGRAVAIFVLLGGFFILSPNQLRYGGGYIYIYIYIYVYANSMDVFQTAQTKKNKSIAPFLRWHE